MARINIATALLLLAACDDPGEVAPTPDEGCSLMLQSAAAEGLVDSICGDGCAFTVTTVVDVKLDRTDDGHPWVALEIGAEESFVFTDGHRVDGAAAGFERFAFHSEAFARGQSLSIQVRPFLREQAGSASTARSVWLHESDGFRWNSPACLPLGPEARLAVADL